MCRSPVIGFSQGRQNGSGEDHILLHGLLSTDVCMEMDGDICVRVCVQRAWTRKLTVDGGWMEIAVHQLQDESALIIEKVSIKGRVT